MAKIQKRLILICAAVLMLVTSLLLAVTASAAAWDGTIASGFAGGSGTSADPYQISNGAELAYLAEQVNGGEDFQGKYIALTADIDLGNVNWTPIGTFTNPFRGNFSGNVNDGTNKPVCTISNLKITSSSSYQGLFGVSTGYLRVVQIKNANITAWNTTQGLNGTGGICGQNAGEIIASYVENCSISGRSEVGGICGINYGTIKNCRNISTGSASSNVSGTSCVGGICGIDYGEITGCVNYSSVSGGDEVGGICGIVKLKVPSPGGSTSPDEPVISDCSNRGEISLNDVGRMIGGICGRCSSGKIINCLNSGEVSTVGTDTYNNNGDLVNWATEIGGICGYIGDTSVEYCINVGKLSLDPYSFTAGNICGLEDDTSPAVFSKCYYGNDISGIIRAFGVDQSDPPYSKDIIGSGEGVPTSALCTVSKLGFDMSVWEDGEIGYESFDSDGFMTGRYLISGNSGGRPNVNLVNNFNFGTDSELNWKSAKKVANRSELEAIKNDMGENYVLVNDIDLSGSEWTPIGVYGNNYYGTFDGNGKTITGLYINSSSGEDFGLFGSSSGTIQNLTIKDCDVSGNNYVGAVSGENYGTITNCIVSGKVSGTYWVGGICGFNSTNLNNCIYIGNVSGASDYGAACGYGTAPKKCFYNSDLCSINNSFSGTGLTTLQLTSSDVLETLDFNTEIWEKKANDKDNLIAYYPNLKKNSDPLSIKYETKTSFSHHSTENGFNISTLVKFDGMADFEPSNATNVACAGSYTITDGADVTITGKMYDNIEIYVPIGSDTHKCVFTFKYDGTNSSFISDFEGEWGEHDYSTKWSSDETDHWKECLKCGDKKDTEAHTFDNGVITVPATEDEEGEKTYTCSDCGYKKTEAITKLGHTHVVSNEYSYDKTGHWKTCSGCSEKLDFASHTFGGWTVTVPATDTSDGKKIRSCTVCGYTEEAAAILEKAAEDVKKALDELTVSNDTTSDDIISSINKVIDNNVTAQVTRFNKTAATEDNEGSITVIITITDSDGNTETVEKTFVISKLPNTEKNVYYTVSVSGNVTADRSSAKAGDTVNVSAAFGYDIIVTSNGRQIARITEKGSFVMPNGSVYITSVQNDTLAVMSNAWNHAYVYSYDSDMNRIKISSDSKRGTVIIKLGSEYAGREFVIYSGRNSTKEKITEGVLDESGTYSFKADDGRNYTLVIK